MLLPKQTYQHLHYQPQNKEVNGKAIGRNEVCTANSTADIVCLLRYLFDSKFCCKAVSDWMANGTGYWRDKC
jgi:hypothetical protein